MLVSGARRFFAVGLLTGLAACAAPEGADIYDPLEPLNRSVHSVNKEFDKAIPLFQDAQKDPRFKIAAMDKTGLCFFFKEWFDDAIDIFTKAIDKCPVKDSTIGKDLRYNLARTYEEKKEHEKALEIYRKLAQLDFNYKDVRKRVDDMRENNKE